MNKADIYKVLMGAACSLGLFLLQQMVSKMDRLVNKIDANTEGVTRLTVQLEEQAKRTDLFITKDWSSVELRLRRVEASLSEHRADRSLHR